MQVVLRLGHLWETKVYVLNVYLGVNIFINISNHIRISSVGCFDLMILFLSNSISIITQVAVIFTFQFVNSQLIIDDFHNVGSDISLVSGSAQLHHGVREGLADAGQELSVVLCVEVVKVITDLVVALPHVTSQVASVSHQQGGEGELNSQSFFRVLQEISSIYITAVNISAK